MRDVMMVRVSHIDPKVRARIRRAVLRHKLDRRYVYTVCPEGKLSIDSRFTGQCSGCVAMDGSNLGCRECGYTGRRVTEFPMQVITGTSFILITTDKAGDTDGR